MFSRFGNGLGLCLTPMNQFCLVLLVSNRYLTAPSGLPGWLAATNRKIFVVSCTQKNANKRIILPDDIETQRKQKRERKHTIMEGRKKLKEIKAYRKRRKRRKTKHKGKENYV